MWCAMWCFLWCVMLCAVWCFLWCVVWCVLVSWWDNLEVQSKFRGSKQEMVVGAVMFCLYFVSFVRDIMSLVLYLFLFLCLFWKGIIDRRQACFLSVS